VGKHFNYTHFVYNYYEVNFNMNFGDKLKLLREEKELTTRELSKIFNLGKSTISNYENNVRKPDYEMIRKFADYFHVSVDWLLGRVEERNQIIAPEGNLHKDNVEFKTYDEIINRLKGRLIEEDIIKDGIPIPEEVLEKIIKHGEEAALEILKLRKKQDM